MFISSHSSNDEIKVDRIIKKNGLSNNIEFIEPTLDIKKIYEVEKPIVSEYYQRCFGRTLVENETIENE